MLMALAANGTSIMMVCKSVEGIASLRRFLVQKIKFFIGLVELDLVSQFCLIGKRTYVVSSFHSTYIVF
jgi:hypothetical protein